MQYGDPTTSLGVQSGSAARNSATRSLFATAMAAPAGLRSHTPINHTASKPESAMASQCSAGTVDKFTDAPAFALSPVSQGHVLIS